MELGISMVSLLDRDWPVAVAVAAAAGAQSVEGCAGGHVPKRHYDPQLVATSQAARDELVGPLREHELTLAAIGCYGNPLHPQAEVREAARADLEATIHAAAELGLDRINSIAGCPAGGPGDRVPNWIVHSLFPKLWDEAYAWQWEEVAIPFWQSAAELARDAGIRLCIEPMAGDVVYNAETFSRLREAAGEEVLLQVDPSHLWWQGIDVLDLIRRFDGVVGFAHAKDVSFDQRALRDNGWLPACAYDDWAARSWSMRAVGHGHDDVFWREYLIALRRAGYDGCVAIELQEPYMTIDDALRVSIETLRRVIPAEPAPAGNWFEAYDWTPPDDRSTKET